MSGGATRRDILCHNGCIGYNVIHWPWGLDVNDQHLHSKRHLNIKEASATYQVSRAKLHRLINQGRLRTGKDPRDDRATLLQIEELDSLFSLPENDGETEDMTSKYDGLEPGRFTAEWRDKMDALRNRITAKHGKSTSNSVEVIREMREERDRQIMRLTLGEDDEGAGRSRE